QPAPQYLSMEEAIKHCTKGIGIWDWASSDQDGRTDLVMAAAGDVPTMEALAATEILQQRFPDLRIRFINVVDIMRLQDHGERPHGLSDREFAALFTPTAPIVFAYHGYPWLIHRLTYRRSNHEHIHVRGYIEEGTTTTPFDMCVLNQIDRFSLAIDAIDRVPHAGDSAAYAKQAIRDKLIEHKAYIARHGDDMPEITGWKWGQGTGAWPTGGSTRAGRAGAGGCFEVADDEQDDGRTVREHDPDAGHGRRATGK